MANWRKITGWTAETVIALILLACFAGYLFLKSASFNQFARRKIGEAVQTSTGAPTTIGSLDFSLSTLTAHAYNITVHGTEKSDKPPLLTIEELTVRAEIDSFLHRKVNLREVIVKHPVAHVQVDKAGSSNLPNAPPSSGSHTNVFDLAVGHAQLVAGELDYNDRKTPLSADLYGLATDIRFDRASTSYMGSIAYQDGVVIYADSKPLQHSFHAKFDAARDQLSLEWVLLKIGNSTVELGGSLRNYAEPVVAGRYKINVDAGDVAAFVPAYRPAGNFSLAGEIGYKTVATQSPIESLSISGEITSQALSGVVSKARISVQRLRANYQLADGSLQANAIQFDSLGGRVNAALNVRGLGANHPIGRLQTSLHDISLQALQRDFRQKLDQTAILGSINGTAEASWEGSVSNIRVRSDLELNAQAKNVSDSAAQAKQVPVSGVIHASYDARSNTIALRQSLVQAQATSLRADGTLSRRSNLHLQINAPDLGQLQSLASTFGASVSNMPAIAGSA